MAPKSKLFRKSPTMWTILSLSVVLAVVVIIGAVNLENSQAKPPRNATVTTGNDDTFQQAETVLRDATKSADQRIQEALKVLDKAETDNNTINLSTPADKGQWDPFTEIRQMQRDMEQMFNNDFANPGTMSTTGLNKGSPALSGPATAWAPMGQFEKTADAYIYRFDMPGMTKDEVTVSADNGQLTVKGKRETKEEETNKNKGITSSAIQEGTFQSELTLPGDADTHGTIQSKMDNGVLTVTIPRVKNAHADVPQHMSVQ